MGDSATLCDDQLVMVKGFEVSWQPKKNASSRFVKPRLVLFAIKRDIEEELDTESGVLRKVDYYD